MTTLLDRPAGHPARAERAEPGGMTLEERLDLVLDDVRGQGYAECPVCCGSMAPADGGGARCDDCGSTAS